MDIFWNYTVSHLCNHMTHPRSEQPPQLNPGRQIAKNFISYIDSLDLLSSTTRVVGLNLVYLRFFPQLPSNCFSC